MTIVDRIFHDFGQVFGVNGIVNILRQLLARLFLALSGYQAASISNVTFVNTKLKWPAVV